MAKYRTKPEYIEAVQWTGTDQSFKELQDFTGNIVYPGFRNNAVYLTLSSENWPTVQLNHYVAKTIQGLQILHYLDIEKNYEEVE